MIAHDHETETKKAMKEDRTRDAVEVVPDPVVAVTERVAFILAEVEAETVIEVVEIEIDVTIVRVTFDHFVFWIIVILCF